MKNNKFVQQGKLTKSGWLSIVAFLLVAVLALSVALGLVVRSNKEKKGTEEASIGGGMVLPEETEGDGISLTSTVIPKEQYGEYDIMPIAETAQQLTATVTPTDALVYIDWSVSWKEGTSGKWGNGKTVTEYVTVTPTSNGALTANVQCLKAFGEQIIVTASVRGKEEVNATCTVDYASTLYGVKIGEFSFGVNLLTNTGFSFISQGEASSTVAISPSNFRYSDTYSLQDDFKLTALSVGLPSGTLNALKGKMSSSSLSSKVQTALNGLTTAKKSITISSGMPNIRYKTTLLKTLYGASGFNSSEMAELNALLANVFSGEDWRYSVAEFSATFTGTYTSVTWTMGIVFAKGSFEIAATSASFTQSSLVFHE